MKLKNKRPILLGTLLLIIVIILTAIIGYYTKETYEVTDVNENLDAMGLALLQSEAEVVSLLGYKGDYRLCVHGYNYTYKDLQLEIGFRNNDDRVRSITFNESPYTVYRLVAGISVDDARQVLLNEHEYTKAPDSDYTFIKDDVKIIVLSQDGQTVRGYTIELISK